ncbi:MAG: hypothetical protein NC307_12125 [Roseburia sp.]|nr:hypothetical protein [Roseburia sp.]
MKVKNKILSMLIMCIMVIGIIGCGAATDVSEDTDLVESMNASDVADMLEDGATVDEIIDKVEEIKDGNTPSTDKPAGTASPTAEPSATGKPESTAEPTAAPTEKPQATATPEPTAPPHVHEYAESITKQPTCAEAGVKTLTCSCGEVKTEAIAATGQHNWVEEMQVVTIPSTGHVEQVQVQVGTGETRHEYECAVCGARFDSPEAKVEHCKATGDFAHACANTIIYDYPGEPIYETQSSWVVDTPETTSVVGTGSYTCSVCNATK